MQKKYFFNDLESSLTYFYSDDKKQFLKTIRYFVNNNNNTSSVPPLKSPSSNGQGTYSRDWDFDKFNALTIRKDSLCFIR